MLGKTALSGIALIAVWALVSVGLLGHFAIASIAVIERLLGMFASSARIIRSVAAWSG